MKIFTHLMNVDNQYTRVASVTPRFRVGNTLVSILSRFCLVSLILMTIGVGQVWGQTYNGTTWYSLYDATEYNASTSNVSGVNIHTYSNAFVPNDGTYYFESRLPGSGSSYSKWSTSTSDPCSYSYGVEDYTVDFGNLNDISVTQNVTVSTGTREKRNNLWSGYKNQYRYPYTYTYNNRAVIGSGLNVGNSSFVAKYNYKLVNTLRTVYISNVKVPMARHIRLKSSSNTTGVTSQILTAFSNTSVGKLSTEMSTTNYKTVYFRSFLTSATDDKITISCNHPSIFRLGSSNNTTNLVYTVGTNMFAYESGSGACSAGKAGATSNYNFNVFFCPQEAKTYTDTITITNGTNTVYVYVSGTGVLNNNVITWTPDTTSYKSWEYQLTGNATTTNNESGCPAITYSSSNNSYASISNGNVITFHKAGAGKQVTITASQAENYKYKAASQSRTFTIKNVQSLAYRDTTIDISVSADDKVTLELSTLMTHVGNGSVSYEIVSGDNGNLTDGIFYATKDNAFRINASAAASSTYDTCSTVLNVNVVKRTPTFEWWNNNGTTHIYAGDVLPNVAQAIYGEANVEGLEYSYASGNEDVVVVDEDKTTLRVQSTGFTTDQYVTITVNTEGTDYYLEGSDTHTYRIEPKQTPEFYMNGEAIPAGGAELHLLIGETANFSFDKIDESKFSTPQNPHYVSYVHDSEHHTGVLTATTAGAEVISFSQTGTSLINAGSRSIHVYVERHPVNLTKVLTDGTWKVDSVYTGAVYTITEGDGVHALNEVSVTSSDEKVLKKVEGNWKAVGAGTAKLYITHPNTDYWAAEQDSVEITVERYVPVFTWNLGDELNWNMSFSNPVTSTNPFDTCTFSYSSTDETVVKYENGYLSTFAKNGTHIGITVTQKENYKFEQKSEIFYVDVKKLPNHVELTVNSADVYNALKNGGDGEREYTSSGIRLGGSSTSVNPFNQSLPCYNWDDKYIILKFTGVPDKLSFQYRTNSSSATFADWYVQESADGTNWSENLWSETRGESGYATVSDIQLQPDTRYLKLCYSGNFAGYFKDVNITERTELTAPSAIDFGTRYVGNKATERTVGVDWYNIKPCTVTIQGAGKDYFQLVEGSEAIASSIDAYGAEGIHVKYLHNEAGSHIATLHIESASGLHADVVLTGRTDKSIPQIIWSDDATPISLNKLYEAVATSTSKLDVVLTAEDPTILSVTDGNNVTGIKNGTTLLYAYQASNTKWAEVYDTIEVTVTDLKLQHIIWTNHLENVKREKDKTTTITLNAYSDANKDFPITYELDAAAQAFASVSGNTLSVTGWGSGKITAHQTGSTEYVAVSKTMEINSRNPNAGCVPYVLDESGEVTLSTIANKVFTLGGEPAQITLQASCNDWALSGMYVAEYYDNGWHDIKNIERSDLSSDYASFGPFGMTERATSVKIYTKVGATLWHYFKDVKVTLAKYLRLDENDMDFSDMEYGQVVDQQFYVNYSNITGVLDVELETASSQFKVITTTLGKECGDVAEGAMVTIRCVGRTIGTENNKIIISNLDQRLEIPISATVSKLSQQVSWTVTSPVEKWTTDEVQLVATATSELPVAFTSGNTDIAETYQKEDESWWLRIKTDGDVEITAIQAGNDYYAAAETKRTYSISKVTPTITTYPSVEAMTLPNTSLADCDLTGGEASVDGTFAWEDDSQSATLNNTGYTVVFTPDNTDWYNTVSYTAVVPVSKASQEITWNFDVTEMYCNADYTFDASASSGLTVSYTTSDAAIAYVDDNNKLQIITGGEVTITAVQAGNDIYAAASPVAQTFTIHRMAPTIVEMPTAASMMIGRLLSDASLTGGLVQLNNGDVEGSFAWVNGNTTVMNVAGYFVMPVVFTPSNLNWYEPIDTSLMVEVEKYAPVIVTNELSGSEINYGQTLASSTLSGAFYAEDQVKLPHEEVTGTYAWTSDATMPHAGNPSSALVTFTPSNTDWYTSVVFSVPVVVNTVSATTYAAKATIVEGTQLANVEFVNHTKGVLNETVSGTFTWDESVDQTLAPSVGVHNYPIHFTSSSTNYLSGDGWCEVTVTAAPSAPTFNNAAGDNDWQNADNWSNGEVPSGENPDVVISGALVIADSVTVGGLTIESTGSVTVVTNGTLTINGTTETKSGYGDLHIADDGNVVLGNSADLKVNNFILDAKLGDDDDHAASGQVKGTGALDVEGDAYFQMTFDPSGKISYGWYDFVVPFDVNTADGIFRVEANGDITPMVSGVHFIIQSFSESRCAAGQKAWTNYTGTLYAGQGYTVTFNYQSNFDQNVFLFKKKAGAAFGGSNTYSAVRTFSGEESEQGWNVLGNGTLQHIELAEDLKIQVYEHATNSYRPFGATEQSIAVGTSFQVQVYDAQKTIVMNTATNRPILAPSRVAREVEEFRLSLTAEGEEKEADRLWISASEEASGAYRIGHDLLKKGTMTSAKVARMWCTRDGKQLCDIEMPMVNGSAENVLGLFTPNAGQYTLAIEEAPEDASLFLTYNGNVIWDLTASPYIFDLTKGTTEGYGLRIEASNAPAVTTDIETVSGERLSVNGNRKVIIDNKLYIITPEGAIYDVIGKKVK